GRNQSAVRGDAANRDIVDNGSLCGPTFSPDVRIRCAELHRTRLALIEAIPDLRLYRPDVLGQTRAGLTAGTCSGASAGERTLDRASSIIVSLIAVTGFLYGRSGCSTKEGGTNRGVVGKAAIIILAGVKIDVKLWRRVSLDADDSRDAFHGLERAIRPVGHVRTGSGGVATDASASKALEIDINDVFHDRQNHAKANCAAYVSSVRTASGVRAGGVGSSRSAVKIRIDAVAEEARNVLN